MSFSTKVKEELAKRNDLPRHCRIAEIAAIAAFCGGVADGRLFFRSENEYVISALRELIARTFKVPKEDDSDNLTETATELPSGKFLQLEKSISDSVLMSVKWKKTPEDEPEKIFASGLILKNDCCRKAFLKGAFLCAGSVNDPNGSYHLEIVCKSEDDADKICSIMSSFDLDVKAIGRKSNTVVYLKEGANITDALNLMGAYVSQMDFYNVMILKDMRNDVNRKVNCETANLNKTVETAVKQIKDIEYIKETTGLEALNDKLKSVAILRVEYPEASLKDLGEMLMPPLGKSGVNHRLKSISEFADNLRKSNGIYLQKTR